MLYKRSRLPSYRLHKPNGQAVVSFNGVDHYLGKHGTAASRETEPVGPVPEAVVEKTIRHFPAVVADMVTATGHLKTDHLWALQN